jgi:hypothetical protein
MSAIKLVLNTKGGVGKSVISTQILTLLADENQEVEVYEVDNNNRTILDNANLTIKSFEANKAAEALDEAFFETLANENKLIIVDAGGGDDTKKVIEAIEKAQIDNVEYYIPINSDLEQRKNLIDTINLIKNIDKKAKINIILNRANSLNEEAIKEQFINLFGSEKYEINGIFDKIKKDIEKVYAIEDNNILQIVKNIYQTTIRDILKQNKDILENINNLRKEWAKEGKDEFKKKMGFYRLLKEINDFAKKITNQFK